MAEYQLLMPKMGESVFEATILHWNKAPGELIEQDETILEVATDKVDSDVPSPVTGTLKEVLYKEGDTVDVGKVLAIIETGSETIQAGAVAPARALASEDDLASDHVPSKEDLEEMTEAGAMEEEEGPVESTSALVDKARETARADTRPAEEHSIPDSGRYYSPLVLNIAQTENILLSELEGISGSGKAGRVTKEDILAYVKDRRTGVAIPPATKRPEAKGLPAQESTPRSLPSRGDEIMEMDRMRKLIAHHMIESKRTSAHVSSFVEADMTNVVKWRERHMDAFLQREGFKLTYMPIFVEAIVQAIMEYPMINVSIDGDRIIRKKDINIGIATALPSGNLIVPVIKMADQKNLVGIAREMNDIVVRARNKQLRPDDTQGGTYTISNVGTFGNVFGTPIINQPQVAIMAVGAIVKKPAVVETAQGDMIAIRHKMFLSHTYDHRIVDGMLGGLFVKRVGDILENWQLDREV